MSGKKTNVSFRDAMLLRYPANAYVTMFEVANSTGFAAGRWADALTYSLWPSRGHDIEGFEFKSARGDWLKELRQPEKAQAIWKYCNRWWIVVSEANVASKHELPKGWGLLVLGANGMRTAQTAERRDAEAPPADFIASMLRSAAKPAIEDHSKKYRDAYSEGSASAEKMYDARLKDAAEKNRDMESMIKQFEKASGIKLDGWDYRHTDTKVIGNAVKSIVANEFERMICPIRRAAEIAIKACDDYEKAVRAMTPPSASESSKP